MVTGLHPRCPLPPILTLPLGGEGEGGGDVFDVLFATSRFTFLVLKVGSFPLLSFASSFRSFSLLVHPISQAGYQNFKIFGGQL